MPSQDTSSHQTARPTRRRFLRQAVVAAGGSIAMPYVIPSGVRAAPGQPGANDRLGLGFIGIGRQGGELAGAARRSPTAKIVAVADVHRERAEAQGQLLEAEAYQDYRKLLERKDVDAIVTATPEQWRGTICVHACQAGKDLYVEKPMSLTIHEGRLIADAVRKYQRVFQTGSQQRSQKENRLGCELIRNGRLGKLQRIIAHNYPSPWECALPEQPIPAELDWDKWCGPAELVAYNYDIFKSRANPGWLSFRLFSGGEMTGWGSHGFDQVQWALGMDEGGPVEMWTEGPAFDPPTYTAAESGARGNKLCSQPPVFMRYPGEVVMELGNGPSGGAVFVGENGKLTIDRGKCVSDPPELAKEPLTDKDTHLYQSDNHLQNWLDCIKSREKCVADVETGHRSASVCHLANITRRLGRKLQWDPVREQFADDEEANGLLKRPQREKYKTPEPV
ncbi:MAG: gfo/Idh/MocA family oxidoreductase [Armatimonadetes bacterium CG_4_10_14_0_8_um_filter_66_14]|nr:MAG: gfo/Idh/MocA family oxidoreductase [Armatimonadetes bacterium CG_4_10_14_0_8_um_filter_66_14]